MREHKNETVVDSLYNDLFFSKLLPETYRYILIPVPSLYVPSVFLFTVIDEIPKPTTALDYTAVRNPFLNTVYGNNNNDNNSNNSSTTIVGGTSSTPSTVPSIILSPMRSLPPRELGHIWELGGLFSSSFTDLIAVPFTPQRLPTATCILVLDLSKPGDMVGTTLKWLSIIKKRINECIDKLKSRATTTNTPKDGNSKLSTHSNDFTGITAEWLYQQTQARLRLGYAQRNDQRITAFTGTSSSGTENKDDNSFVYSSPQFIQQVLASVPEHPDWNLLNMTASSSSTTTPNNNPSSSSSSSLLVNKYNHIQNVILPLQTIVVGHRWDTLKDIEAPKRRTVLAALRFIGLSLGGHVVCTSARDTSTMLNFRHFLYHALFQSEVTRLPIGDNDGNRPLMIPAGTDTLDLILGIYGNSNSVSSANNRLPLPPLKKSDFETTLITFPQRLERFHTFIRQYFPSSLPMDNNEDNDPTDGGSSNRENNVLGSTITFTDEAATVYPETVIDILRTNKAEELQKYMRDQKEKERKLVLEQKAAAVASNSSTGGKK